jgi:hypothetical protein
VKGPGSILDARNTSLFANLEKALPEAIAKACPGVREVILKSGSVQRLVRINPSQTPALASGSAVQPQAAVPAPAASMPQPAGVPAAPMQASSAQVTAVQLPSLVARSNLQSYDEASKMEDKCEVLLQWLESGKGDKDIQTSGRNYLGESDMMTIFRDEPMTAVFGVPYDKLETRWRFEQYQKVISHCMGVYIRGGGRISFGAARNNQRASQEYSRQFEPYGQLLRQAFPGESGVYDPSEVRGFVQDVRTQLSWANQAMATAAQAKPDRDSFDRIAALSRELSGHMSRLRPSEKKQAEAFLAARQAAIAPGIVGHWFDDSAGAANTLESARTVQQGYTQLRPVLSALVQDSANNFRKQYENLMESLVREFAQTSSASLKLVHASIAGLAELRSWKQNFDATFSGLASTRPVQVLSKEYSETRATVDSAALAAWQDQISKLPWTAADLTAKRHDLETIFPSNTDRFGTAYASFSEALRERENQFRVRNAEEQQGQVAAGNRGQSEGLNRFSLSAVGLGSEDLILKLYVGDFNGIDLRRDSSEFASFFEQYLEAYGGQCDAALPDPGKVPILQQVCSARYERSGACGAWESRPTGLFAEPSLYAAKKTVDSLIAGKIAADPFGALFKAMNQIANGGITGLSAQARTAYAREADMTTLVATNGCRSRALKRFEDNIRRFALDQQPVGMNDESIPPRASIAAPILDPDHQDYRKLSEDLIAADAKDWTWGAQFVPGSVINVAIASKDNTGLPRQVTGHYIWIGSGRTNGTFVLDFANGKPSCLTFPGFAGACRPLDRKIVTAYENGSYQR